MSKACECGCGALVSKRYVRGHNLPQRSVFVRVTDKGYVLIFRPYHERANKEGFVFEHVLVAERALGRPLPCEAQVHHVNEDKADNRPENLVVCENQGYHALLHRRMRALQATGRADDRKCPYCKEHDRPARMRVIERRMGSDVYAHDKCYRGYHRKRSAAQRAGVGR